MRLEAPTVDDRGTTRRVEARVAWEGPHRGPDRLWFEVDAPFTADLLPSPEAFLVAALPLAAGLGEPRLAIDARVCSRLREGLDAAMRVLAHWYPTCRVVPVEAERGFAPLVPRTPRRTAAFLTGGVDSLSMLRANRDALPLDHPGAIVDGIFLFGWNTGDFEGQAIVPARLRAWDEQRVRLERFGAEARLTIVPVRTNVGTFQPDWAFYRDQGFGAGMIAAAHALPGRWTDVWYASGGDTSTSPPHATHPLLDPLHATGAVDVHFGEPCRTRLEKVRAVARWPAALAALQVCYQHEPLPPGRVHCGRCEKCVRTILALVAAGRFAAATTFPACEPAALDLRVLRAATPYHVAYLVELATALRSAGERALADGVQREVVASRRRFARRRVAATLAGWLRPRRARA
jgi:hypothetical protein